MHRDLCLAMEPDSNGKAICLNVTSDKLRKCKSRFNPGSGSCHDYLLPQQLKDLGAEHMGAVGNYLLDALCRFFTEIVLPGNIPVPIFLVFMVPRCWHCRNKD